MKLNKICKYLVSFYLLYILVFGVFSYLIPFEADYMSLPDHRSFYAGEAGVDRAVLVEHPDDAFARRVELIRSAENSLDICYHCVKSGETTDCLLAEIIKAADRGVHVRLLLDGAIGGLGGARHKNALALRSHPNIEYRTYNPIRFLRPWGWNVRLHDKFMLADDRLLMLGGRNIGDEYFAPPWYHGKITNDRDVIVINTASGTDRTVQSVVNSVQDYMELLWSARETHSFRTLSTSAAVKGQEEQKELLRLSEKIEQQFPDYYFPACPAADESVVTNKISLLYNPVSEFKKEPVIGAALFRLLASSNSVRIQTPYATANVHITDALKDIAESAEVDFLTNSIASTPNYPAFSAYYTQRKKFIETGIQIYEYQSTDSLHGKSCTADDRISVIGSLNLDDRSLYIDTESVLVIDSPEFTGLFNQELDSLFAQSASVGKDNQYLSGQSCEIAEFSDAKLILLYFVSLFSRLFQYLI